MNRKLDLSTGTPVWSAYRAPKVPTDPLTRDVTCDVLVVGLGISGAMIAEALTAEGLSVVGLDRRTPMRGSTRSTTALIQFEIDQPITSLTDKIGRGPAEQAWRRSRLSVTNLRGRIEQLGIACRLETKPSLYLAGNVLGPGQLREEANARNAAGIRATYLTPGELKATFGIDRDGAILSSDNLAVDPRKLTAGFLLASAQRKARFFSPVEVSRVVSHGDGVVAETGGGPTISAKHAVLTTGYELLDIVPSETHSIISTYAIATKPQPNALWPQTAFIWEASEPYLYLRATADGRVICGGEDEEFQDEDRRDALLEAKSARIATKLKRLLPRLDTDPAFAWTGSFGTTTTGLPYIGPIPGRPRVFAVQGYGGNGITFSQIASELIASAFGGRKDTDAALFAFNR